MWLIIPIGFYSIVHKDEDENELTIRSRSRRDLENLRDKYLPSLGRIVESHDSDYRFRSFVSRIEFNEAMGKIIADIDYRNVKAKMMVAYPERISIYGDVWWRLGDIQE